MTETFPLEHLDVTYGAQVPIRNVEDAEKIINCVLVPDAKRTISRLCPDESTVTIEIRGKVCSYNAEAQDFTRYGADCTDDHKGRQMCGIAWLYSTGRDPQNPVLPEGPLFDFDGELKPIHTGGYYELARMKIELQAQSQR